MKLPVFDVYISKVDASSKKELAGAVLTIKNADGNTFDFSKVTATQNGAAAADFKVTATSVSFKSVDNYKTLVSGLKPGKYILTETTVPNGYEQAEDITFTVGADGKVSGSDTVVMEDKASSTPTPTPADIVFSKKDFADKGKDNADELTGAKLKLTAVRRECCHMDIFINTA